MTGEAVRMATKGGVDGLAVENYPSMAELFNSYLRNKGQLGYVPPVQRHEELAQTT